MSTRVLMLAAVLVLVSCDVLAAKDIASPAASHAIAQPTPSASTLPRADEERSITAVLASAGVRLDRVLPSKFDWLFGDAAPRTGIFSGYLDGQQVWADVHFLERPVGDIAVCTERPPASEWTFTVSVQGQPQVSGSNRVTGAATSPLYFAVGQRYFVMASDLKVRDALGSALGLSIPLCPTRREPSTLPVFPEEQAVVAALDAAGIRLSVIGGSKFETLLGERQRARVFIQESGSGGADVLFLDRPIARIRVCVSQGASGLNRYEIFIGDRKVSDGEGTQTVLYSVSDRYFVQAIGKPFSDALMRGLGTVTPPC